MLLRKLMLVLSLCAAPLAWGQFGKADMIKLATDRVDSIAKALNLSPDQISKIKPLLESKYTDMGAVKDKFMQGDKSDASKKEAVESLKSINSKYDSQIDSNLNPDQVKQLKGIKKAWKDDLSLKVPKI